MPGDLNFKFFFTIFIFFFKTLFIISGLIIPGLRIFGVLVKSITVDSIPILDYPPSIISFIFFLKSSATFSALTGLIPEDKLALGIARGKSIFFNIDLTTR